MIKFWKIFFSIFSDRYKIEHVARRFGIRWSEKKVKKKKKTVIFYYMFHSDETPIYYVRNVINVRMFRRCIRCKNKAIIVYI